jgi:predicted Zn-dependent protease|tara:strand:- start:958 stop:2280 length:1323 start_codon:yes stop_codon:yes gene_type:complete
MEKIFNQLCEGLFSQLLSTEALTLSFSGENSQFIRINNASIRQTGLVDDATLGLKFISNNRTCEGSITVSGHYELDLSRAMKEVDRMRLESKEILEDPFLVIPTNAGSSREIIKAKGLNFENSVEALIPSMQGVDLVGIFANGRMFRGNANSLGQKHWFETESHCLDYSLVTPERQMVKGTYAGTDWDQNSYESYINRSIEKLDLMKRKPIRVEKGMYRTWFEAKAVADFIDMFSWNGISEASLQQGCSGFGKMRHNDVRLSPKFSISEDFSSGMVPKFNSNGERGPESLPIISNGILKNTLVSSRSSAEYGISTNYAEETEELRSPLMSGGDLNQENILSRLDKGLFLSNIHYLNWSDNPGGRITGLTRYACFWVEGGEIVAPIETMRFDDTFYRFFGSELESVGSKVEVIPDVLTYGQRNLGVVSCPGILTNEFQLTL